MIQLQGIKLMVLPNKVTQNVELFVEALENCRVTRLFAVTSLIRNILALLEMEKKKDKKSRLSNVSINYYGGKHENDSYVYHHSYACIETF